MLLDCIASCGEEPRLTARAGFQSMGLNSMGSYCFLVSKPCSGWGALADIPIPLFLPERGRICEAGA